MGGDMHFLMTPVDMEWSPSSFPSQQLTELRAQFRVFSLHFFFRVTVMSHYNLPFLPLIHHRADRTRCLCCRCLSVDVLEEPELRHRSRQTPAST